MRKKLFRQALIDVLLDISPPSVGEIYLKGLWFALRDVYSGNFQDGSIVIDLDKGYFATHANVGEQNAELYYEVMAYNPSGDPTIITWGMMKTNPYGNLRFHGKLDPITSAWIKSYGLNGTSYGVRPYIP
jgi:hypothetical protein